MPQIIALAIASTVAYAGYKWIAKQNKRSTEKVRAKAQAKVQPRDLGELYWDEAAGAYRPRR